MDELMEKMKVMTEEIKELRKDITELKQNNDMYKKILEKYTVTIKHVTVLGKIEHKLKSFEDIKDYINDLNKFILHKKNVEILNDILRDSSSSFLNDLTMMLDEHINLIFHEHVFDGKKVLILYNSVNMLPFKRYGSYYMFFKNESNEVCISRLLDPEILQKFYHSIDRLNINLLDFNTKEYFKYGGYNIVFDDPRTITKRITGKFEILDIKENNNIILRMMNSKHSNGMCNLLFYNEYTDCIIKN